MPEEPNAAKDSLIPPQPIPAEARVFSERMHDMLDGKPKDHAMVEKAFEGLDSVFDLIAAGLYHIASMLVGEGEESIRLVETAVTKAEVSTCDDAAQARRGGRRALCAEAIGILERRSPGSLAAPQASEQASTCIEDDDLDAASSYGEELEKMMAGSGKDRVRAWLESLPAEQRVVFVLRAVAGLTSAETAAMLVANGGPSAAGWTADAVREVFRQALCSLASQLIHATTAR
ncbi:MAG: hypothetical protein KGM96_07210 [Acidobacteriota bacterium]|nr:hypothetical protein [Acidobacteriota bacterium]